MSNQVNTIGSSEVASGGSPLVVSPVALIARVKAIEEVRSTVMVPNVHYYSLDKADKADRKWSLSKAGAEMLQLAFGLSSTIDTQVLVDDPHSCITVVRDEWTDGPNGRRVKVPMEVKLYGFYEVKSTCTVLGPGGQILATASGSCNSHETAFKSTAVADAKNSILKRSEKRAFVAAMLMATGSSGMFTQDVEDMIHDQHSGGGPAPAAAPAGAPNGLNDKQNNLAFVKAKALLSGQELDAFMGWFKALPKGAKTALDDLTAGGERANKVVNFWKSRTQTQAQDAPAQPALPEGGEE